MSNTSHPEPDAAPLYVEDGAPHALVPGTSTDDPPGYPGDPRWCDRCGRAADDPAHAPTPPALAFHNREFCDGAGPDRACCGCVDAPEADQ